MRLPEIAVTSGYRTSISERRAIAEHNTAYRVGRALKVFVGPWYFAGSSTPAIKTAMTVADTRTPCPPYGYSCSCHLSERRQIELVAEFHAYRIRPTRIAYRLGIDIALIDALLGGEHEAKRFEALVAHYRKRRFNQRLRDSEKVKGQTAYEQREKALQDLKTQTGV